MTEKQLDPSNTEDGNELDKAFDRAFRIGYDIGITSRMLESNGWYGIKPEIPNEISDIDKMSTTIKPHLDSFKNTILSYIQSNYILKSDVEKMALGCDNSHGYIRTEFFLSTLKERD